MQPGWRGRGALWLLLMETVRANRRHYPTLPTAWLPHGLGNSLALWAPELLARAEQQGALPHWCAVHPTRAALYKMVGTLCRDNPAWGLYVGPAALGYILSHPRFNIYQGEMGTWRALGFGLDALPHALTAFALTLMVEEALDVLAQGSLRLRWLRALARRPALGSALALTLLSLIWEAGEYLMQQDELRRTGGAWEEINMKWDIEDMGRDFVANAIGWALARAWQARPFAPDASPN